MANPTRSPARAYALLAVRTTMSRGYAVAERKEARPDELRVRLVEHDDRRFGRVRGETFEERFDGAVRLGEPGRVVRAAQPDDAAPASRGADRIDVEGPALSRRSPRDGDDLGTALLGQHPVHRVGRCRQDGTGTLGEERLGDQVEDLVCPGAHEQLVGADAVAGGRRLGEPAVVRRRVLRQRRVELARGQQAIDEVRRSGGGVEVEADDRVDRHAVAFGDLLVRCLPRVGGRQDRGRERDRRRAHRSGSGSPSKRASTASRWASRPSASASVVIVSRMVASPSRSMRWTCTNLP